MLRTLPQPDQRELDSHFGYIYLITNTLNDQLYVGQHHHLPFEPWSHYMGSGTLLRREQERLGMENFQKNFVEWVNDSTHAVEREELHIMRLHKSGARHYNEKLPERSKFPYGPPKAWEYLCGVCELPSLDGYSSERQRVHWCYECLNQFTPSQIDSWLTHTKRPIFLPEVEKLGEVLARYPNVRAKLEGFEPVRIRRIIETQVLPRLEARAAAAKLVKDCRSDIPKDEQ